MTQYLETIDQSESLGKPFLGSVMLHAALVVLAVLFSVVKFHSAASFIGSPKPGGGAVGVSVVHSIPLPSRPGLVNPLANDSKTVVPLPPPKPKAKPEPKPKAKAPAPDALPLPSRNALKKPAEKASPKTTYRAPGRDRQNQLYSDVGPAMKSPMIQQTGAGGVGIGQGSTLGTRFGWYADLVITRVAQHWNPDQQQQSSQAAIVTFTLMKDGSVKDVKLAQRSGNSILDFACQRAILDSVPFQSIPDGAGNSVNIELVFKGKL